MNDTINIDKKSDFGIKLSATSFICAVLIVYQHAVNITEGGVLYAIEDIISVQLTGRFAVNIFFMISGLLFFNHLNTKKDMARKLKGRFYSIVLPYFFYCTISYCFFLILTNIPFLADKLNSLQAHFSIKDIVDAFVFSKYSTHLWYLRQLMLYILVSPLMWVVYKKNRKACKLIVLVLLLLSVTIPQNNFIKFDRMFWYFSFVLFYDYVDNSYGSIKRKRILPIISIFTLIIWGVINHYVANPISIKLSYYIMPILFWRACDIVAYTNRGYYKYSFCIYAAQVLLCGSMSRILELLFEGMIAHFIIYLFVPALYVFLMVVVCDLLRKRFPVLYRIISGNR